MPKSAFLGEWEQLVLMVMLREGPNIRVPALRDQLAAVVGRPVARGALYATLDRLEDKAYIQSEIETATPERGGHPTRSFLVTRAGRAAVDASRRALQALWKEIDESTR